MKSIRVQQESGFVAPVFSACLSKGSTMSVSSSSSATPCVSCAPELTLDENGVMNADLWCDECAYESEQEHREQMRHHY